MEITSLNYKNYIKKKNKSFDINTYSPVASCGYKVNAYGGKETKFHP